MLLKIDLKKVKKFMNSKLPNRPKPAQIRNSVFKKRTHRRTLLKELCMCAKPVIVSHLSNPVIPDMNPK